MTKYKLHIADEPFEFTASTDQEILDAWRGVYVFADSDNDKWRRTAAIIASDKTGSPIRYDTTAAFIWDITAKGLLERVDEAV